MTVPPSGVRSAFARTLCALLCACPVVAQHPAFAAPPGFALEGDAAGAERVFVRTLSNGDRLRVRVRALDGEPTFDDAAKKSAAEATDTPRDETRQEISVGALTGVAYSCLGASETVEGVPFTRYRRVMALKPAGAATVAVRADVLAKEPKPAQSTLEAMSRALGDWQTTLGGSAPPPPDAGGDPASRPGLGGSALISLSGGADLELRVPAAWGRADLTLAEGRTAVYLGPARDVLKELTVASLAKDKDRLGPYLAIERVKSEQFELVDKQLLDIADSLLADYAAQQEEAGITLKLGERDEGTLGTRVVISAPFEESRASGTKHKGRLVMMMHRGYLAVVVASHPLEGYEQGWEALAAALDTLLFTGAPEPDPAAPPTDSKPADPAPADAPPSAAPPADATTPPPAGPRVAAGALRLPASPAEWSAPADPSGVVVARIPLPTPLTFAYPSGWTLFGDAVRERGESAFVATPDPATATAADKSRVRVEYRAFREELTAGDPARRLAGLVRTRLAREAAEQGLAASGFAEERRTVSGANAAVVRYALGAARGVALAVAHDGTSAVYDLRVGAADAARLDPMTEGLLSAFGLDPALTTELRSAGPFAVDVPADWTFDANENRAGGYDVFLRAPSGVDVRFQTARQSRPELVNYDVLRRVSNGFLVDALKVISSRDFKDGARHDQAGARVGMRFATNAADLSALALVTVQEDQLVYAMRGAPTSYRGRDLALAWRAMRSFGFRRGGAVPGAPRVAGAAFSERVVFTRTNFDELSAEGAARSPSSLYVAFLPDGTAGIVVYEGGAKRDLRGAYRIDGDLLTLTCESLGPQRIYRLADEGETLDADGADALFRDRREERP
jgi:hypothetical protein